MMLLKIKELYFSICCFLIIVVPDPMKEPWAKGIFHPEKRYKTV
jgi:hypothetical protein